LSLVVNRQKFVAKVPSLEVNISDERLLLLMSFLRNFPVPTSASMATLGEDVVDGVAPSIPPVFAIVSTQVEIIIQTLLNIFTA
jgi:hypothetical protein